MPPLIPTGTLNLQVFAICLVVGAVVFWFLYKTSHAQLSKQTDCVPSKSWSAWGDCTSNCQGGLQYRTRTIAVLPLNGGAACNPNDLVQSRSCNDDLQCGQNCIPGNPNKYAWAPCPPCTNADVQPVQYKYVPPLQTATQGGQDCSIDDVFLYRSCEKNIPPCAPDIGCVLSPYYETPCNVPCGSGTKFVYSSISRFPSGNGAECDMGLLVTQEACFLGSCNCDSLTWSETFSECNAACGPGIQIMMRDPQPDNAADGLCPFFSITECELTACPNLTCTAPSLDFVQALCYLICAGFSTSDIDIDPSICLSDEIYNAVCGFNATSIAAMLSSVPDADVSDPVVRSALVSTWFGFDNCQAPKNCSLSSFSSFSACSLQTCQLEFPDGGTQTRVRIIEDAGNSGGIPCTDQIFIDFQPCNNYTSVSYTAWNEGTQKFVSSVSNPQCQSQTCQLSNWYSVSGFRGGCGATCTQIWNRSISNAGSNPGTCPTNPVFFVSTSTCCGVNPDAQQTNCAQLPTCVNCLWETITNLTLNCPAGIIGTRTVTIDAVLKSETNIPGTNCYALGSQCSWESVLSNPTIKAWSPNSCSSYYRLCTSTNQCPSGCDNLVCSGHGVYSISTVSGTVTCSCVCDPGFSGTVCATVLPRCPVASVSGLECNGLGRCSGSPDYTCDCNNANDTTVDCTGSSSSWCWVYGITNGTLSANTFTVASVRKLLGAIPIASVSSYTFTEKDCLSLSEFGTITYADPLSSVRPQPVLLGMNDALGSGVSEIAAANVKRAFFQGSVESQPPATLITQLPSTQYCHDFMWPLNSQAMLSQTFGSTFASKFIPRFLPGTSPLQCESLFTLSVFTAFAQQSLSVLSLSALGASGPVSPPFAGVGKVVTCQPIGPKAVGTFSYRSPANVSGPVFSDVRVSQPSLSTPLTITDEFGRSTVFLSDNGLSSDYTFGWSPPNIFLAFPNAASCTAMLNSTSNIPARVVLASPTF